MDINVNFNIGLTPEAAEVLRGLVVSALTTKSQAYVIERSVDEQVAKQLQQEQSKPRKPKAKTVTMEPVAKPDPKEIDNEPAPMDDLPFGTGDPAGYVREEQPEQNQNTAETLAKEAEKEAKIQEEKAAEENTPERSAQDVRAAMEQIRLKFGDDKNKADNDVALHKSLTQCFKAIAQDMGYDKPSAIDDGKKRWEYIAALDNITVNGSDATPF